MSVPFADEKLLSLFSAPTAVGGTTSIRMSITCVVRSLITFGHLNFSFSLFSLFLAFRLSCLPSASLCRVSRLSVIALGLGSGLPIHVAGLVPFGYVLCVALNNNIVRVAGPGSIAFLINDTVSLREFADLLLVAESAVTLDL